MDLFYVFYNWFCFGVGLVFLLLVGVICYVLDGVWVVLIDWFCDVDDDCGINWWSVCYYSGVCIGRVYYFLGEYLFLVDLGFLDFVIFICIECYSC